ncbi:MAG: ATP-binding cassette, subfamily bacterial [Patescibacteria group bacterium]|jgi:ATP-binding cassette subfamily B protein|nr:ATP-binding cassette, subfamily bacterial [Patescibacteria group bacterium]
MKAIWKIIKYSKVLWPYYTAIAIVVVITSALNLVTPFVTKGLVDGIVSKYAGNSVPFSQLGVLVLIAGIASVFATLLSNLNGYWGDMMSVKLNSLLSERYFTHLMKLPVSYYDNEITGKITARLDRSIGTITQFMQTMANNFVQFFLTTIVTLIIIAFYSWPVALLLALIFPIYIYITNLSSNSWQKHQEGINTDLDLGNGRFVESIVQVRVVKSFVMEASELLFYGNKRKSIEHQTKGQSVEWHKYDVYRRLALNIIFTAITGIIIYQAYIGVYNLGTMTLLLTLSTQAQFPLFGSSFIIDALQRATAGSKDYFDIMDTKADIVDKNDARPLKIRSARVEYQNVGFSYEKGKSVLKNVSFTIDPGKKLALVGESGEGKSTLANLMLRFYEINGGNILIDGQPIDSVTQESLRSSIGVVFQEPQLFSGNVKDNISYGVKKPTQKQLVAAAKAANAYDFIKKLPKGFDTEIGERGVKLSGGQKQRIAIARAIMKNPPILILDEATSSLDSKAEHEVQTALERLMANRTTMIIAHRLSTISDVDTVVGIKNGQVVEIGSPQELAKRKTGIYKELLDLQTISKTAAGKAKLKKLDMVG